jgi:hypothetical protein
MTLTPEDIHRMMASATPNSLDSFWEITEEFRMAADACFMIPASYNLSSSEEVSGIRGRFINIRSDAEAKYGFVVEGICRMDFTSRLRILPEIDYYMDKIRDTTDYMLGNRMN